jgi:hypothetical protein
LLRETKFRRCAKNGEALGGGLGNRTVADRQGVVPGGVDNQVFEGGDAVYGRDRSGVAAGSKGAAA